ncbi:MAG: ABC transporter permease [Clostridia bacterium]|jgi:multidrug/hemolysin transport system permease protein|nr:ABC transporter permease [Clostridia bacterium]
MKLWYLIRRNCKIYFKDKGLFFTSLIAPLILFFLFVAFLGDTYRDSLITNLPEGAEVGKKIVEGFTGGWLMSSLIAVCAVTIAFTANMVMVQDKVHGQRSDLKVSPVSGTTLALGYYLSTALVTLMVCGIALVIGYIYLAIVGWYLSIADFFLTLLDTVILVLFGTALSSIVCRFLKSQGGITAVEVIVSAAYGFLCGAYMPISSLADGISHTLLCLPGTYGTALMHEHFMGGAIDELGVLFGGDCADQIRRGFDCTLSFFGSTVSEWVCFLVICLTVAALIGAYVLLCTVKRKKKN